jgi:hypothetical protein
MPSGVLLYIFSLVIFMEMHCCLSYCWFRSCPISTSELHARIVPSAIRASHPRGFRRFCRCLHTTTFVVTLFKAAHSSGRESAFVCAGRVASSQQQIVLAPPPMSGRCGNYDGASRTSVMRYELKFWLLQFCRLVGHIQTVTMVLRRSSSTTLLLRYPQGKFRGSYK